MTTGEMTLQEARAAGLLPIKGKGVSGGKLASVESSAKKKLGNDLITLAFSEGLELICEHHFAPPRQYRSDWAFPHRKILIEYEGGRWQVGFHQTSRYSSDCEKYNLAALEGWRVLRFTTDMVRSGLAMQQIAQALGI